MDDDSEVGVLVMPLGCHQAENHCKDLLVCLWVPSAHGCSRLLAAVPWCAQLSLSVDV